MSSALELTNRMRLYLGLAGVLGGLVSTLLGVGGGAIMVPVMILLGIPARTAIGSSLAAIVPISLIGLIVHLGLAFQRLDLAAVGLLFIGSFSGARLGSIVSSRSPDWVLKKALAVLLLMVGLRLAGVYDLSGGDGFQPPSFQFVWLIVLGLFAGFISALLGIGGGVIVVPMLVLAFGFPIHVAVVTSLGMILPTSFIGAIFHYRLGHVNFQAAITPVLPALVAAVCGAFLADSLDAASLSLIFGLFLLTISTRLFLERKSPIKKSA
jgi:uncharacterized membrane protein YfcA